MREIDQEALDNLPPNEREEARRLLAALQAQYEANPLLGYNHPEDDIKHPKQLRFHAARTYLKIFIGGNRAGKTTAGIGEENIQAHHVTGGVQHFPHDIKDRNPLSP